MDSLTSNAIHEQIPATPSVLDRFETSPTMMYSGSYLEAFITGSINTFGEPRGGHLNTRGADSHSEYFNSVARRVVSRVNGNLAGGGTVGPRHSLLRGVRLVDPEEQYYDSMQPDPASVLMNHATTTKLYSGFSTQNNGSVGILFLSLIHI